MALPKNLVYAIRPSRADSHFGCRENDNPHIYCKQEALRFSARGHFYRAKPEDILKEVGDLPIYLLTKLSNVFLEQGKTPGKRQPLAAAFVFGVSVASIGGKRRFA
jgi:hypothetical protein